MRKVQVKTGLVGAVFRGTLPAGETGLFEEKPKPVRKNDATNLVA